MARSIFLSDPVVCSRGRLTLQYITEEPMEQKKPYIITEKPGTKYYCACARSQNMPYCDGAHKGSGLHPDKVEIEEEKTVAICSCRSSANLPFCDGAHKTLQ